MVITNIEMTTQYIKEILVYKIKMEPYVFSVGSRI